MIYLKNRFRVIGAVGILFCFAMNNASSQNTDATPVNITIQAKEGLQFDLARFAVRPGANVKLTFKNTDEMAHNLLITLPGERLNVVKEAQDLPADIAASVGYVPRSTKVLYGIAAINPSESRVITFKAPTKEGIYPYVCTFPGHGYVMYGAMYVTNGKLPSIQSDLNVPESRRNDGTHDDDDHDMGAMQPQKTITATSHPYKVEPPTIYRTFMPDASPDAIAVNLSDNISYCWDATYAQLRYVWYGGFLDNGEHWKGNGRPFSKILGSILYRDIKGGAIRIGNIAKNPVSEFKGYKLQNKYPQFIYTLDGAQFTEVITSAQADGQGIVRTFTANGLKKKLYFVTDPADGMTYSSTVGKWKNGVLKLSPKQARRFSITITKPESHHAPLL